MEACIEACHQIGMSDHFVALALTDMKLMQPFYDEMIRLSQTHHIPVPVEMLHCLTLETITPEQLRVGILSFGRFLRRM